MNSSQNLTVTVNSNARNKLSKLCTLFRLHSRASKFQTALPLAPDSRGDKEFSLHSMPAFADVRANCLSGSTPSFDHKLLRKWRENKPVVPEFGLAQPRKKVSIKWWNTGQV